VPIDVGDEMAIAGLARSVRERTGISTAVLHVGEDVAHLEVLEGTVGGWAEPDLEIPGRNPWNRLGWFTDMTAEVYRHVPPTGEPVTMKHWSISAIVRVPTLDGDVWWKQVPSFMAQEGLVTRWLGDLLPDAVPDVIAVGPTWCLAHAFHSVEEPAGAPDPLAGASIPVAVSWCTGPLRWLDGPERMTVWKPEIAPNFHDVAGWRPPPGTPGQLPLHAFLWRRPGEHMMLITDLD
jgi:hypothetical protein